MDISLKTGDMVEVSEELAEKINPIFEQIRANINTIEALSRVNTKYERQVWKIIRANFPELDEFELSYDMETNTITLLLVRQTASIEKRILFLESVAADLAKAVVQDDEREKILSELYPDRVKNS